MAVQDHAPALRSHRGAQRAPAAGDGDAQGEVATAGAGPTARTARDALPRGEGP